MSGLAGIFFDILGPVLLLIGVGVAVGKWLGVAPEPLAKLAYWVIGPVFIFDTLAFAELAPGLLPRMLTALVAGAAGAALFGWLAMLRRPRSERSAVVTDAVYGNVGNYGLAVVVFTFGEGALALGAIGMVTINTIGVVVGVASAHSGWEILRRATTSPLTLAVPPAVLVNAFDVDLPPLLLRPIGLLAAALIPLMLITLGIHLRAMGRPVIDLPVVLAVVGKLIVQPAVAFVAVALLGLAGDPAGTVIIMAAMPTAVFAVVLTIEQNTAPELTSTAVLVGTLASVLTLPVVIALVQ